MNIVRFIEKYTHFVDQCDHLNECAHFADGYAHLLKEMGIFFNAHFIEEYNNFVDQRDHYLTNLPMLLTNMFISLTNILIF